MRDFTDSYCERCGTRYTFGPTPSKGPSLVGARVLAKGLKNFVMSDEASMHDAMAAARIDVERGETTRIAEEFHRTFNFCMTCRQYACDKCWNPNQSACLSCAPLWDFEPVAPEDHLIIRTPVARPTLEEIASTIRRTADVGVGGASTEAVPWPSEDPLPSRPEPRHNVEHASESTASVPEVAQLALAPQPTEPALAPQPTEPALAAQPTEPALAAQPTEPALAAQPTEPALAAQPTEPPALEPQPQIARSTAQEQQAAQELRAQSQSWKSHDDGWTLWPTAEEAHGAELTREELILVQAQLSDASPYEKPDLQAEAFTPAHTLSEEATRLAPQEPGRGTKPETPAPGAWEPEVTAPQTAPSSDLDLPGSLGEPIEFTEPPAPAEPHRAAVFGRLLGHRAPIAGPAQEQAPRVPMVLEPPKPAKASAPDSTGQAGLWPRATAWAQRPIERRDWWTDSDAAALEEADTVSDAPDAPVEAVEAAGAAAALDAASEPAAATEHAAFAEPSPAVAEPEPALGTQPDEPVPASRTPEPVPASDVPAQQLLFTMPPATAEPWPATRREVISRPVVDGPANDPLDEKWAVPASPAKRRPSEPAPVASQSAVPSAPWPPIGATWPMQHAPAAPSPGPGPALVSASVAAARQAEQTESPLVAAIWAESAQEVLNRGNVRVCHRCALPVSTHARFCRRCGTQQA